MYVYKSTVESGVANAAFRAILLAAQSHAVPAEGKAPVSACKPLCAIFLRKPSVYPLSPVKANVGHLCEKLKNAMRNGWGQRCDGNFLTIFAGTILSEKLNFTGGFFEWRRPFDFSTRYLITPVTADALKKRWRMRNNGTDHFEKERMFF